MIGRLDIQCAGPRMTLRPRRKRVALACLAALTALSACSDILSDSGLPPELTFETPDAAVVYEPALTGAPSEETDALLRDSLAVFRRADKGAPTLALLRRRAEQDETEAVRILRSQGYYSASATSVVSAAATEGDAASAGAAGAEASTAGAPRAARAEIVLTPGEQYVIAAHRFVAPAAAAEDAGDALAVAAPQGAPEGSPARAIDILAAESAAIDALRAAGRPWATVDGRRAVADPDARTLTVETRLTPGPRAVYGALRIEGAEAVETAHIASYADWREGEAVSPRQLRALQRALAATDLFSAVSVDLPETPPRPDGAAPGSTPVTVPVTVRVEERPARSVAAGARYDTDSGALLRASIEHRNLFGAGETARLSVTGGAEEQSASLSWRAPQFRRPGQDLTGEASFRHRVDEAFEETAVALQLGLERRLAERWSAGLSALIESARIIDEPDRQDVLLLGAPAFLRYDSSDAILDPTTGLRLDLGATPFVSRIDGSSAPFFLIDARGSAYVPLDEARRFVLAGRTRLGAVLADALADVPANRRLYSGGGGSVRGYRDRYVGPLDAGGEPVGGRMAAEAGIELRARVIDDFGAVAFVEAGAVDRALGFSFEDGVQTAAGVGLRYYSPVGPIRADIATPLDPRPDDEAFQLYFSIGQAF